MMRLFLALGFLWLAAAAPHSGYDDASAPVRAMQDDDTENPGFLWVQQGAALWSDIGVPNGRSCGSCHGVDAMRGVAARYPAFDGGRGRPVTLEERVNLCRTGHQAAAPLAPESDALLGITAWLGLQSRGLPMSVRADGEAAIFAERGRALFQTRMGQLNLSCANCHDGLAGQRLGGSTIPQGQPNGYPLYRLEWQALGSLTRRLQNCLTGVRAEPMAADSPELVALQFYLGLRATGLAVETPAVRP